MSPAAELRLVGIRTQGDERCPSASVATDLKKKPLDDERVLVVMNGLVVLPFREGLGHRSVLAIQEHDDDCVKNDWDE